MARIHRNGTRHQKNFSLREYKTWEAAKRAGGEWVKEQLKKLPPRTFSKGLMTVRNTSGAVGVYRHRQVIRKPSGQEYEYYSWVARWPGCKFKGGVKWSILQFGDDDAFVLAVLCRQMEAENSTRVMEAWESISGTKEYRAILTLRER
jgi:hypothetical protein